jgi:hypothetical protein
MSPCGSGLMSPLFGSRSFLALACEGMEQEWNRQDQYRISTDSHLRTKRLPQLFTEFAQWDKSSSKFTRGGKKNSDYLRGLLAIKSLRNLTKEQAPDAYNRLNSGHIRTKRFGADYTFANDNAPTRIRRALAYLLWSDADITNRISALLPGGRRNARIPISIIISMQLPLI